MKAPLALLFVALVGAAAFFLGRGKPGAPPAPAPEPVNTRTVSSAASKGTLPTALVVKPRFGPDVLSTETAGKMTPEERVALLKKASVLADPEKQADILVGLISVMTQEELLEGTKALLDAQRRGNEWSQEVWNALWTQWGRVNAEACLALSKTGERHPDWNGLNGLNTSNDYRCLMAGWLEAHPEKAMAWAREPKDATREAAGAAFAITSSAQGDLERMHDAILSVSGNELTMQACLQDYFDLANSEGKRPSEIYEGMDSKLRSAAWPQVMWRLSQGDVATAAEFFAKHGNDPGRNEEASYSLVGALAEKDPEATVNWAIGLSFPSSEVSESYYGHPAAFAIVRWMNQDPVAAQEWLRSQPSDSPWKRQFATGGN